MDKMEGCAGVCMPGHLCFSRHWGDSLHRVTAYQYLACRRHHCKLHAWNRRRRRHRQSGDGGDYCRCRHRLSWWDGLVGNM